MRGSPGRINPQPARSALQGAGAAAGMGTIGKRTLRKAAAASLMKDGRELI